MRTTWTVPEVNIDMERSGFIDRIHVVAVAVDADGEVMGTGHTTMRLPASEAVIDVEQALPMMTVAVGRAARTTTT